MMTKLAQTSTAVTVAGRIERFEDELCTKCLIDSMNQVRRNKILHTVICNYITWTVRHFGGLCSVLVKHFKDRMDKLRTS